MLTVGDRIIYTGIKNRRYVGTVVKTPKIVNEKSAVYVLLDEYRHSGEFYFYIKDLIKIHAKIR